MKIMHDNEGYFCEECGANLDKAVKTIINQVSQFLQIESLNTFDGSQAVKATVLLQEEQNKHRWIPVSQRLPEVNTQSILVCLKNGGVLMGISCYSGEFKEISSMGIKPFYTDNPVIAWMPMPEPYEQED